MHPHDQGIIHSSQESDWRTPPACFAALHDHFTFRVDGAANADATLCPRWYGPGSVYAENALEVPWEPAGPIFLNPPFSREKERDLRKAGDREGARCYAIAAWAEKCWLESQAGCTIVGLFPFAPQTDWYRKYVYGHTKAGGWSGHAAREERRLPHRISFLRPDGSPAGNAGVNTAVIVWGPRRGTIGPWQPWQTYWSWR